MKENLSASDLEFAKKFNLTVEDLIGFIEDMKEAARQEREKELQEEFLFTSPEAIYPAW